MVCSQYDLGYIARKYEQLKFVNKQIWMYKFQSHLVKMIAISWSLLACQRYHSLSNKFNIQILLAQVTLNMSL